MKIAIIVSHFPPKWSSGGTEIASYFMAEHLARRGHEVHVITSFDEGLPQESCEKGFYIHRVRMINIRLFGVLFFWRAIVETIRKIDPDLVHTQSLCSGIPALISKKILKIPYAVWAQGSDVYHPDWFTQLTSNMIVKNADSAIALTEDMKRVMQDLYDRDIAVVPNGFNIADYPDEPSFEDTATHGKSILFVGRLKSVKGVQYLITSMKKIHEEMPDARLILVGDGEERERLAALSIQLGIQQYVQFIGIVPHEKVKTFMQQADVFVLPSLSEGLPIVILEAMACGLPIVASRVGGIPDILTNDTNGYLVEAKDTNDMANKIILLLSDDALRKKISDNNRLLVKKYAWENVIFKLEKIYELSIS
jgi:glycosyltransferase involved in cell wall biosynthesis